MSVADALVAPLRKKRAERLAENRAAVERALMYEQDHGVSKYWQAKQCRLKGKVFDRKTGECRAAKRVRRGCGPGSYWNKKTGACQKRGKLVTFKTGDGKTIKFRVAKGTDKDTKNTMARHRLQRMNCRAGGGRPYAKRNGNIACTKGPARYRLIGPRRQNGKF
jgi:nitrite reductase/ring-hydroxylating ferredoxin subunit